MRYDQIMTETMTAGVLHRSPMAMGLESMMGDGFALVGGFRSGNSPPGLRRCRYMIYDTELYAKTKDDQAKVGTVDLFIGSGGAIQGLVDIKLDPKKRRAGIGAAIIKSLIATAPAEFRVYDIKKTAVGFWRKMGAEITGNTKINGANGIIRKG